MFISSRVISNVEGRSNCTEEDAKARLDCSRKHAKTFKAKIFSFGTKGQLKNI